MSEAVPFTTINMNGEKNIRVDMWAVRLIERATGTPFPVILADFMEGRFSVDRLLTVVFFGMQSYVRLCRKLRQPFPKEYAKITDESLADELQEHIDANGGKAFIAVVRSVVDAINAGMGEGPKNDSADQEPATPTE